MTYLGKHLALIAALALAPVAAHAEIVKTASPDCKTSAICLHWWPKVAVPDGWMQIRQTSEQENINFLVPKTASDTRVFIYANAIDHQGQSDTLDGFISDDIASFKTHNPGITVTEEVSLTTADGQTLRVFRFDPASQGRWELAAYGQETDKDGNTYFLDFVLSGKTQALRDDNLGAYKAIIAAYRQ